MTPGKKNTSTTGDLPPRARDDDIEHTGRRCRAARHPDHGEGHPGRRDGVSLPDRHAGKRQPMALQPVRAEKQPPRLRQDHRARPHGRPAPGCRDLRGRLPARQHRARPARRIRPRRAMTHAAVIPRVEPKGSDLRSRQRREFSIYGKDSHGHGWILRPFANADTFHV